MIHLFPIVFSFVWLITKNDYKNNKKNVSIKNELEHLKSNLITVKKNLLVSEMWEECNDEIVLFSL